MGYFKPLRRKFGVLTLIVTTWLAFDWCASYARTHTSLFISHVHSHIWLESNRGMVELWYFQHTETPGGFVNDLVGTIHYMFIVGPLTALSSYLLLSKLKTPNAGQSPSARRININPERQPIFSNDDIGFYLILFGIIFPPTLGYLEHIVDCYRFGANNPYFVPWFAVVATYFAIISIVAGIVVLIRVRRN